MSDISEQILDIIEQGSSIQHKIEHLITDSDSDLHAAVVQFSYALDDLYGKEIAQQVFTSMDCYKLQKQIENNLEAIINKLITEGKQK